MQGGTIGRRSPLPRRLALHEFALADAVAASAVLAASEAGIEPIERIVVAVGELQQIERELFEFSLTQVLSQQQTPLAGTEFVIEEERARFACRVCEEEFALADVPASSEDQSEAIHFVPELAHAFLRCPNCGSPDYEVLAGRGVTLLRVEGQSIGEEDGG